MVIDCKPPHLRSIAKRSRAEEEALARTLGAQRQSGSGNQPGKRGDLRKHGWLGEVKNTHAASFRITRGVLDKIAREADDLLLKPFVAIGFWSLGVLRTASHDWLYGFRVDDIPKAVRKMGSPHRAEMGRHSGVLWRADTLIESSPLLVYLTGKPVQGWVFLPERTARVIMEVPAL